MTADTMIFLTMVFIAVSLLATSVIVPTFGLENKGAGLREDRAGDQDAGRSIGAD